MFEQLKSIAHSQPYPLLFATISGAHLYGFPSPDSDYDLRGVHILPPREVLGLYPAEETISVSELQDGMELDLVTHDIKKFFELLLKKSGEVLEQIYSPLIVHTTPEHEELKRISKNCITRFHAYHYLGISKSQWTLFEKEEPRRVKPLLYVYRTLLTGIHMMQTGQVEANLLTLNEKFQLPYVPELIERKRTGAEKSVLEPADWTFHQGEYVRLRQILEEAKEQSHLTLESACKDALNDLLLRVRGAS